MFAYIDLRPVFICDDHIFAIFLLLARLDNVVVVLALSPILIGQKIPNTYKLTAEHQRDCTSECQVCTSSNVSNGKFVSGIKFSMCITILKNSL